MLIFTNAADEFDLAASSPIYHRIIKTLYGFCYKPVAVYTGTIHTDAVHAGTIHTDAVHAAVGQPDFEAAVGGWHRRWRRDAATVGQPPAETAP